VVIIEANQYQCVARIRALVRPKAIEDKKRERERTKNRKNPRDGSLRVVKHQNPG
jgi:hypothetical protein